MPSFSNDSLVSRAAEEDSAGRSRLALRLALRLRGGVRDEGADRSRLPLSRLLLAAPRGLLGMLEPSHGGDESTHSGLSFGGVRDGGGRCGAAYNGGISAHARSGDRFSKTPRSRFFGFASSFSRCEVGAVATLVFFIGCSLRRGRSCGGDLEAANLALKRSEAGGVACKSAIEPYGWRCSITTNGLTRVRLNCGEWSRGE